MQTIDAGDWTAQIPDGWLAEEEEDGESVLIFHPDGPGTLQVTCSEVEEGLVGEEDLRYFAGELIEDGLEPARVHLGHLQGLKFEYVDEIEDEAVIEWYLAADDLFFFITYACPPADRGHEEATVGHILHSIEVVA
jgi:hypothetical protein